MLEQMTSEAILGTLKLVLENYSFMEVMYITEYKPKFWLQMPAMQKVS